jgi:nucleoside 2-deoxyribosyltransferase
MTQSADKAPGHTASTNQYAVFLATPMSGFGDDAAYARHRTTMLEAVQIIRDAGIGPVYFAGEQIASTSEFTAEQEAFLKDFDALRASSVFCLVYPQRVISSALIELGVALALDKPTYVFTTRRKNLPYLVSSAEAVGGRGGVPPVQVTEYADAKDLGARLRTWAAALRAQVIPLT